MRRLLLVLAVIVPSCGGSDGDDGAPPPPPDPTAQCYAHLQSLHAALLQYQADNGTMPATTGGVFWIGLSLSGPPYVTDLTLYACPVKGVAPPPGSTDYRGPAGDANTYTPTMIIGADKVGSHGAGNGGHVLLKNGTLALVAESDALWIQAAAQTAP